MAFRKNKKFIDPRYFMDEKTDIIKEAYDPTNPRALSGLEKSMDAAEAERTLKEEFEDEVAEMASYFDVEASVEVDDDFGQEPPPPDRNDNRVLDCQDGVTGVDQDGVTYDPCKEIEDEQELKRQELEVRSSWIVVNLPAGEQGIYHDIEEMYQDLRKKTGY
jgi:hypothetical protein